jgi:hypothetical protein
LREAGQQYLAYVDGPTATLDLSKEQGTFQVQRVDLMTGGAEPGTVVEAGKVIQLPRTDGRPAVFWLVRHN